MPFSANCPSCGAPVVFKSAASFHAVCEFCRSTLVRHGDSLENLGRMADLLEDASPVRLGTEGVFRGVHFAVIGRLQLTYAAGVWNEWHLLFDDMRSGWLADAGGEYVVSFLTPPGKPLPAFDQLVADDRVTLAGREFAVSNFEKALCIAGEGELPFAFGAGYEAPVADLRATDESGAFASIDYSESPPLFFVGEAVTFDRLRFANLRADGPAAKPAGKVKALACPSCGSAITLHDRAVQSVACPACLTVLDAANDSLKILRKVEQTMRITPRIPLGSIGRFEGREWTVIGFQQRALEPVAESGNWQEYLLHHPAEGFRWLVEDRGHWSWVRTLSKPPRYKAGMPAAVCDGEHFKRFYAGVAVTNYVIGEFTWKVGVGESWQTLDFIAPPRMLSREAKDNEVNWSLGEYFSAEDITAAFRCEPPLPAGHTIGAIQPNPRQEPHRRVCKGFWLFLLVATLAQLLWAFVLGGRTLLDQRLVLSPQREEPLLTQVFTLDKSARNLVLRQDTDLDNNWIGQQLTLVNKATGEAWVATSELSHWSGVEDGESWSEGDRTRELMFRDLPAGQYYFVIDADVTSEKSVAVADRVRVISDQAAWSNYILLLVFLVAWPLLSRLRVAQFESRRWEDADFLPGGAERGQVGSDDDDSDSGIDLSSNSSTSLWSSDSSGSGDSWGSSDSSGGSDSSSGSSD